jgi:hypothetical protein
MDSCHERARAHHHFSLRVLHHVLDSLGDIFGLTGQGMGEHLTQLLARSLSLKILFSSKNCPFEEITVGDARMHAADMNPFWL